MKTYLQIHSPFTHQKLQTSHNKNRRFVVEFTFDGRVITL